MDDFHRHTWISECVRDRPRRHDEVGVSRTAARRDGVRGVDGHVWCPAPVSQNLLDGVFQKQAGADAVAADTQDEALAFRGRCSCGCSSGRRCLGCLGCRTVCFINDVAGLARLRWCAGGVLPPHHHCSTAVSPSVPRLFHGYFAGISLPFRGRPRRLCQNVCILSPRRKTTWENAPPTGQVAHILAPDTGKPLRFF